MSRKWLLGCGIASSTVYFAMDILGSLRWEGYSYLDQTVSELAALGAPSRPIAAPLGMLYNVLVLPFAAGVWSLASRNTRLWYAAGAIAGVALAGIVAAFFPIQMRGAGVWTINETMHVTLTSITVLCIIVAMIAGAKAGGRTFFVYSMVSFVVMLVAGAIAGRMGEALAANLPTPWMGVAERACIFSYLVWVIALAAVLMRKRAGVLHGADVMLAA